MPLRGVSVLVVEDDKEHLNIAVDLLVSLGARVIVAANGKDALKRLLDGCPDLILCDVRMPVMDGLSFAREVRSVSNCRQVRMVAVTAATIRLPRSQAPPSRGRSAAIRTKAGKSTCWIGAARRASGANMTL